MLHANKIRRIMIEIKFLELNSKPNSTSTFFGQQEF